MDAIEVILLACGVVVLFWVYSVISYEINPEKYLSAQQVEEVVDTMMFVVDETPDSVYGDFDILTSPNGRGLIVIDGSSTRSVMLRKSHQQASLAPEVRDSMFVDYILSEVGSLVSESKKSLENARNIAGPDMRAMGFGADNEGMYQISGWDHLKRFADSSRYKAQNAFEFVKRIECFPLTAEQQIQYDSNLAYIQKNLNAETYEDLLRID